MRPRGTIQRSAIIDAALAVADRQGLRAVTVRAVAAEAGVSPMSLYTHVSNKERLLDVMFEDVVRRLFSSAGGATWRDELVNGARNARKVLLAHPHWLPLFTRAVVPVASLRSFDTQLDLMRRGGLSLDVAMSAISSIMAFTLGLVLVERMMAPSASVSVPARQLELVKNLIPTLPRRTYSQLAAASSRFARWSFDGVFETGLQTLMAGIQPDRARARRG